MNITRTVWAWEVKALTWNGYWRKEGGIWPRIRLVRPANMDDYFYGSLAGSPNQPIGLQEWLEKRNG